MIGNPYDRLALHGYQWEQIDLDRTGPVHAVRVESFCLDRTEVTNRPYKTFVDAGGYRTESYWKEPFVKDGRTLPWNEAMALLRDGTGRPGPLTWELGSFPEGREDYPVSGVSWYEASAYAEFAGKRLPTFFHWYRAAELGIVSEILLLSNFGGEGPAPVGRYQGLGPFGALDQAGNVREWCSTAAGDRRYTLGGAWNDPTYLYHGPDALRPWDRSAALGFRCVRYTAPPSPETLGPVEEAFARDYTRERPVDDEVFSAYRSLYTYDRTPLDSRVEGTDDSSPYWRRETISFAAAYGDERVRAYLFVPKSSPTRRPLGGLAVAPPDRPSDTPPRACRGARSYLSSARNARPRWHPPDPY